VDGLKGRARGTLGVQDGTMRLSRAQYEVLFERVRRIRNQSGGLFSRRKWRRVMAQRVAPATAAG